MTLAFDCGFGFVFFCRTFPALELLFFNPDEVIEKVDVVSGVTLLTRFAVCTCECLKIGA